ncbi:protein nervous wreck [Trichonephila clavipes]|nr:protein nervous wreck [Trichonephila clavipes]
MWNPHSLCPVGFDLKLESINFQEEFLSRVVKHSEIPYLIRQLALETINCISQTSLQIYTDSSRGDGGISGSGVHILTSNGVMDIKIKNPNFCSVFRSELIAIRGVLQYTCEHKVQFHDILILTDSRASVQHLPNWTSIGDQTSLDILNLLDQISSNHRIHFQWVSSHRGLMKIELHHLARTPPPWYFGKNPGGSFKPMPRKYCQTPFSSFATNSDELSFVEQEELELINEGDGDGWVMARNYRGEEGYIPQNYVEVVEAQAAEASSRPPLTSFSSVDYTMPSEDKEAGIDVDSQPAPADTNEVAPISELATTEIQRPTQLPYDERISCCQALYDYEATCDEELSFYEGQIIKILRKKVCDVDDGWWEGELDGQVGLFPSLVVEELKENGEPLTPSTPLSPPEAPPPPAFTPPEAQLIIPPAAVILTQPTPEIEHPGAEPQAAETTHNYAPLVSSPDSPTKTMAENLKEEVKESDMKEEINSEITSPSVGTDDCPTVVITAITGGDTPVSDEDMEIKEETPAAASSEVPEKDVTASSSSGPGKDTASFSAVGDKDGAVSSAPEKNAADAFGANPDAFECSFDDDFASQHIPQEFPVAKKETSREPEPVKMEINGTDKTQSLSSDGNQDFFSGVAEGSETTG